MLFIELLAASGHWVAALHLKLNVYHHSGNEKFSFIIYKTDLWLKLLFVFAQSEQLICKTTFGNHCTSFAVLSSCSWELWCWHLNADCWSDVSHKHQTDLWCWHFCTCDLWSAVLSLQRQPHLTVALEQSSGNEVVWRFCIWDNKLAQNSGLFVSQSKQEHFARDSN